jgi:DNA-binding response OmpR family regulator
MERAGKLLIVEDDPVMARALVRQATLSGYEPVWTMDLAGVARLRGPFEAAIIDLHLPDGSGMTLAQGIPALRRGAPVVFFSATTNAVEARQAELLAPFVPKSWGAEAALLAVSEELARRSEREQTQVRALGHTAAASAAAAANAAKRK